MEEKQIIEKIHAAYIQLLARDGHLFTVDANERSITHKLAECLQSEFPGWNVDCEYNRNLHDAKVVPPWEKKRNQLARELEAVGISNRKKKTIDRILDGGLSVYPDIIIHHRGTKDNLVVIEAKKSNYSSEDLDEEKLRAYKKYLDYRFAFKITFPVGGDFEETVDTSRYIQKHP